MNFHKNLYVHNKYALIRENMNKYLFNLKQVSINNYGMNK